MAHVAEELALCTVSRFGDRLGIIQLHFGTFTHSDFGHHGADCLWLRLLSHQGEVRNLPVSELAWTSVCLSTQFEVKNGRARSEHPMVKRLENVGQLRNNLANGFTIVFLDRQPGNVRQTLVDFQIPQLRVHHSHTHRGSAKVGA